MARSAWVLQLLVVILLAGGCAARGGNNRGSAGDEASLRVQNQSWLDMRIYVVASGQRVRLGTVNAASTSTLGIPAHVIGLGREVSFLADPLASSTVAQSFSMYVDPGDEVTLTIPPSVR